jgi:hypothetical protein
MIKNDTFSVGTTNWSPKHGIALQPGRPTDRPYTNRQQLFLGSHA